MLKNRSAFMIGMGILLLIIAVSMALQSVSESRRISNHFIDQGAIRSADEYIQHNNYHLGSASIALGIAAAGCFIASALLYGKKAE